MKIKFGVYLDGTAWSDAPASLGEMTCGPLGLLAWLEEKHGLAAIEISQPERIGEYKEKIKEADCEWCRKSFALDAWSCAKQLLAWRDELVEAGWTPDVGGSERLDALCRIEKAGGTLPDGPGDRLRKILASNRKVHAELILVDEPDGYPPVWRKVIEKFFPGYSLRPRMASEQTPELTIVTGNDSAILAPELARYLVSAKPEERIALICSGDTALVDGVFHRSGLPAVGGETASICRESLQILPLWIENMWDPFDAQKLLDLLLLKNGPFPGSVTRPLADALPKAPGIGGEFWNDAWDKVEANFKKYHPEAEAAQKTAFYRTILEWTRFSVEAPGIPSAILTERLKTLNDQLSPKMKNHPELGLALSHIKTLVKLVDTQTSWTRFQLSRMLDSILSTGATPSGAHAEATPFTVFSNPGQLTEDFDTVIWWNFVDPATSSGTFWSQSELSSLTDSGCVIDKTLLRRREAAAWRNVLVSAKQNLICFLPKFQNGDLVPHHPWYDELENLYGAEFPIKIHPRETLSVNGVWTLAGHRFELSETSRIADPKRRDSEEIPLNSIQPETMSPTQMDIFLSCPFRWFLERYAGLRDPAATRIPSAADTMTGTLAHKVVELLFREKKSWTPEEAARKAGELFDGLLPQMGAELLADGREIERSRIRETLSGSISSLVGEINKRNLTVVATEMKLGPLEFCGSRLHGDSDIVLKDADGHYFVIDLKWSFSSHYTDLADKNKSVQLAAYAKLLDPETFRVKSAYYLFPKSKFFDNPQNDAEVWNRIEATYRKRLDTLHKGRLKRGISPELYPDGSEERERVCDEQGLSIDVIPCGFCKYNLLCGKVSEPVREGAEE